MIQLNKQIYFKIFKKISFLNYLLALSCNCLYTRSLSRNSIKTNLFKINHQASLIFTENKRRRKNSVGGNNAFSKKLA